MKKRLLLMLVLALLLALGIYSAAWAATVDSGECGDDLTWTLDSDGTLTISGNGAMEDYELEWDYQANEENHTSTAPWGKKGDTVKKIIVNSGVTNIGANSFYFFDNLEQIDIASSVYVIGEDAFSHCENLEVVDIPNGVKYIEKDAFANCINLTKISIPASVLEIEVQYRHESGTSFAGCDNLMEIKVDSNNSNYSSYKGALYDKEKFTLLAYPTGKDVFEIYSGTKIISYGALLNCNKLTDILIPDNIEYIHSDRQGSYGSPLPNSIERIKLSKNITDEWSYLFDGKDNLIEVILPESLPKSINLSFYHTFENCINLKEIKVPENVTSLNETFAGCEKLETVYLPVSLKTIAKNTFSRCYSLKKVIYSGSETQWAAINIENGNNFMADAEMVYLNNSGATDPEDPDDPNKPTDPEQPDKPTNPDKPTTPEKPDTLPITSRPGGLGSTLTVRVEGGHWLTVQVRRAGSIAITSVQAPGRGLVSLTFSAAAGSVVQVWETENEMTFTNGVPNNKILATNVKNV